MTASILVTGGTGTLGVHVVRRLRERGCDVRVLSRKERAGSNGLEFVVGDLVKGLGVGEAVADVEVIVHCASDKKGDVEATRNLVKAAQAQRIPPHLVYISIVGASGVPFGYFQTKLAAEKIVVELGVAVDGAASDAVLRLHIPWSQEHGEAACGPCSQEFPVPAHRSR